MVPSSTRPSVPVAPAQETYTQTISEQEDTQVALIPTMTMTGQTSFAHTLKALLRPFLKSCYYVIQWIRKHKVVSLLAILLLLASVVATSYFVTGTAPFASPDTIAQNIQTNPQLSPDVQNWLIALRTGDLNTMLRVQKSISTASRSPDSALYVLQFSEKYGGVTWTKVSLTGLKTATDGLVDTLIDVDMTQTTTSGTAKLITLWHFTTLPSGQILLIDYVSSRSS